MISAAAAAEQGARAAAGAELRTIRSRAAMIQEKSQMTLGELNDHLGLPYYNLGYTVLQSRILYYNLG